MSRIRLRRTVLLIVTALALLAFVGLSHAETEPMTVSVETESVETAPAETPSLEEAETPSVEDVQAPIQLSSACCNISCNILTHYACCNQFTFASCRCEAIGDENICFAGGPGSSSCSISVNADCPQP